MVHQSWSKIIDMGIFPAVTAGWRINNEEFLKNCSFKLEATRAGYGEVGNQSIGDNARFGLYEARYGPNQNVYYQIFNIYYNVGTAYDLIMGLILEIYLLVLYLHKQKIGLKWETTKRLT
jgi:hypothetical protein